ncbi:hypothetical protein [Parachlamydia acanthamoebae]|uniref:hypothetical protein n=1 Tax=Parachlamydia acanthamoebae TaxID=83552 RepID=UPI000A8A35DD|nr:hypothetical protein [Parachlamydia acanthamoebae]
MQFKELEKDLKTHLSGDVHFDEISRKIYSVDASIYEIDPIGIVLPRSKEDLIEAVKIAKNIAFQSSHAGLPLVLRAAVSEKL